MKWTDLTPDQLRHLATELRDTAADLKSDPADYEQITGEIGFDVAAAERCVARRLEREAERRANPIKRAMGRQDRRMIDEHDATVSVDRNRMVRAFFAAVGQRQPAALNLASPQELRLGVDLVAEEFFELLEGVLGPSEHLAMLNNLKKGIWYAERELFRVAGKKSELAEVRERSATAERAGKP
jgi:hypothetical protein